MNIMAKEKDSLSVLTEMLHISKKIVELSSDSEDFTEQLAILQLRQQLLRDEYDSLLPENRDTSREKITIAQCLEVEREIKQKLIDYRVFVRDQLEQIQQGNVVMNSYNKIYTQVEGYFIDKQR